MRPKNRKYCVRAHKPKLCFESEKKALNFIKYNSAEIEEENGYAPIRAYYCVACGGWHLSSQPIREPETPTEDKPKYRPSYSQQLINDQGYYHLIGYFRSDDIRDWKIENHGTSIKDPEVLKEFWMAYGTLIKEGSKELCNSRVWWVVRGPQGKMVIHASRGTAWLLGRGEQVGTDFERLSKGLFYRGGEIKILERKSAKP